MRRSPIAILLALALSLAAGLLPAAAPGVVLPAPLLPATALAADDIVITTGAQYTVDTEAGRVRVTVDITAINEKPDRTADGTVTRYYYDGINLGIQPEARSIRATQGGTALEVKVADRTGYRLVTVGFGENLYQGQSTRFRLSFVLPGGKPRSDSDIRVGPAFATFTAWAFGDGGSVRVRVPSGFRVDIAGEEMEAAPGADGYQAWTATTDQPLAWYALVTATNDDALARDRLVLPGGDEVVVRGWPDDRRWRTRVRSLLEDGVPDLVGLIGLPWPVDGSLVVTEVHTPLLEGYAGFYDPATDRITISEDLDDLTILHEASHAWFNRSLFTERWITEGLADEYSARVLRALGRGYPAPEPTDTRDEVAFPLADWAPPAAIQDEDAGAREAYGYAASWALVRRIVGLVGEDGMRRVFAAAAAGTTAYPGDGTPEPTRLTNDWRRFIDLAQGANDLSGIPDLVASVALGDGARQLLHARAAARRAYADLVDAGGTWAAPVAVRMALDRWTFDEATAAMGAASAVLATRDELRALAGTEGLDPPDGPEAAYQAAASSSDLAAVDAGLAASLEALRSVAAAAAAERAPRDWLTGLGLEGSDPGAQLGAARDAWEAGDLDAARAEAATVVAELQAAPDAGRARVLTVGGGAGLVLVLVLLLAVVLVRRRRLTTRPAYPPADRPAAPGGMAHGVESGRDPAGPYATLRPDGPPAEPPGRPPSGDEGADRS